MSVAESIRPVGATIGAMYAEAYRAKPQSARSSQETPAAPYPPSEPEANANDTSFVEERDYLDKTVEQANNRLRLDNRTLRFRINEDSGDIQVQIIDSERDKVIRSIPSDEMIKLSARMREFSGIGSMVDQSR